MQEAAETRRKREKIHRQSLETEETFISERVLESTRIKEEEIVCQKLAMLLRKWKGTGVR